jgi:cell wall-associated NlpC family hydrolase
VTAASSVGGQSAANTVTAAIQAATPAPAITQVAASAKGLVTVKYAESQLGVPYVWGGESPGVGFDCSGLVQWAWARAGVTIPRTTESQWPALEHVPLSSLQPGDLLYYYNLDGDHLVDHLVMYVGSAPFGASTVIAAAHSGTTVSYAPLFTAGLIGAARP